MQDKSRLRLPKVVRDLKARSEARKIKRAQVRAERAELEREGRRLAAKQRELRRLQRAGTKRAKRDETVRRNAKYRFKRYGDPLTTGRQESTSQRQARKRGEQHQAAPAWHRAQEVKRERQAAELQDILNG